MKKKVAFLFGAGAETGDSNYNIPLGNKFKLKTMLREKEDEDFTVVLKKYFTKSDYYSLNHYSNIEYQRNAVCNEKMKKTLLKNLLENICENDEEFKEEQKKYIKNILSKDICNKLYKEDNIKDAKIADKIFELWFKILKGESINVPNEYGDYYAFFEEFANFYINDEEVGVEKFIVEQDSNKKRKIDLNDNYILSYPLDDMFRTIVDPVSLGRNKFFKVFNYYWSIYFFMIERILNYLYYKKTSDFKFFEYINLDNENKVIIDKTAILHDIIKFTEKLYEYEDDKSESYYSCIGDIFTKSNDYKINGIITTNYFNYCEKIFKEKESRIAYINGELRNFEFPESLDVFSADNQHKDKFKEEVLYFPFVFGQSYIKPIVHPKQVQELSKMDQILKEADTLIILGYNLNADDNHLNSYLHDFIENQNKKIIYVVDVKESNEKEKNLQEKLRIKDREGSINLCKVDYESDNNKSIILKILETLQKCDK